MHVGRKCQVPVVCEEKQMLDSAAVGPVQFWLNLPSGRNLRKPNGVLGAFYSKERTAKD